MKYVNLNDVKIGMITAEAIYNKNATIELLKIGTTINDRHINMLKNLDVQLLPVYEEKDPEYSLYVEKDNDLSKVVNSNNLNADLIADLKEAEAGDYFEVERSVYNRNMEIHVLTGESNTPIDEKYKQELVDVKTIFHSGKDSDNVEIKHVQDNVKKMLPSMLNNNDVMMRLKQLEETDDYLFDHSFRVSLLAANVAKWLKFSKEDIENVATASLMYEIGNLKIPQEILNKKGPLNAEERSLIKKHPQLGYHTLLKTKGVHRDVKIVALQHHERLDGSGYPLGVKSSQIHEFSKIIMVCDIFDAMTQDRPYRKKISPFEAAEYILWESGKSLDMRVCYFFLQNLAEFYTGKTCVLADGNKGKIIHVDVNYPTRPVIKVGEEFIDLSKDHSHKIIDFD